LSSGDQLKPETIASPDSSAEDLRAIGEALHAVAASDLRLARFRRFQLAGISGSREC
jgi:hypothetical protein